MSNSLFRLAVVAYLLALTSVQALLLCKPASLTPHDQNFGKMIAYAPTPPANKFEYDAKVFGATMKASYTYLDKWTLSGEGALTPTMYKVKFVFAASPRVLIYEVPNVGACQALDGDNPAFTPGNIKNIFVYHWLP